MTRAARSALCLGAALAMLAVGAPGAVLATVSLPSPQALYLPADLSNVCEASPQALQQAIDRHWHGAFGANNSLDQWTQLIRSFACDLSGSRDLGWHRVPLRAYESAIRYPLTWTETETVNGRVRRQIKTYYSAAQLPPRIDFWVGGRIDEIRYDRRLRRLDARFFAPRPAQNGRGGSADTQCAATTLQFRQQNGLWLLSGVEPTTAPRC
ncbi:hypothetical protein P3W85_32540 [Cupriavidus basilensis]|uniref:Uncharacterized protein n=1 Tax=Cupriavidus basilensis TaxID=68895 RepID=A0ABT6AYD0_9BURK|nr:hypothetical protein [Cupriavidus basilensis]MDF3837636.1 hypothetical protein [Cupriavidus basilensis]